MRRDGASMLVGGNGGGIHVCVFAPAHMHTHVLEGERDRKRELLRKE